MSDFIVNLYRRVEAFFDRRWVRIVLSVLAVAQAVALAVWIAVATPEWAVALFGRGFTAPLVLFTLANAGWWLLLVWLRLLLPFLLTQVAAVVLGGAFLLLDRAQATLVVEAMAALAFTFIMLTRLVLIALQVPYQPAAIAHTVVKEALRLRVSVFFILVLLVVLPIIPVMGADEPVLRYRIQSFINWSVGVTFALAACMTIFLACATVSFEIRDRQIWQVMTKPVGRFGYLLGKWLGVMCVNLVILLVAGLAIFGVVRYLEDQPAADTIDRHAVTHNLLTARIARDPNLQEMSPELLRQRVDEAIENDYTLREAIESGMKDEFAERRAIARRMQTEYLRVQRAIPPGAGRTYVFPGLQRARQLERDLELQYVFHIGDEDTHEVHPVTFVFGDEQQHPPISQQYVPTQRHTLPIPHRFVDEDGRLHVTVYNGRLGPNGALEVGRNVLNFDPDGFRIWFTVGGFNANFARALLVVFVKLAFLAVLGIAAATLLSFPVATLLTFTVFFSATLAPFLAISLQEFHVGDVWRVDRWIIKGIGHLLVLLFGTFGEFSPTESLVQGRLIPWTAVGKSLLVLGGVWSGISLAFGYLVFRERELATYSGRG